MASSCSWLPCCASIGASRLIDSCASVVVHRGVSDSRGLMVPAAGTRRKPLGSSHCLVTRLQCNNPDTNASTAPETEEQEEEEKAFARLGQYVELNAGSWSGTFTQFDGLGKTLACVPIKLKANIYGKGEHASLYQTLYVKQAKSSTSVSGDEEVPEWVEYKIQEIDALTINRLHKVGYFTDEKAYCLSHLTAEMLDAVLRAGLLGEDDDEATEVFPGVRLPCRRPALVNESCLYSESGNSRVRAFHVFNPQGLLDMIGVFHEHREEEEDIFLKDASRRMERVLGEWSGHAVTQRTGIYGSTLTEQELLISFEKKNNDDIVQTISRTSEDIKLVLNGTISGDVMRFMDGLQTTLLPGGMSMTSPVSVGNCVRASRSFCLEFSWIDTPQRRRRLVRTYDTSGMVVSTTLSKESRV